MVGGGADKRRVLVTGCSSGIGRAVAAELEQRGYHVIATARDIADLENLAVSEKLALDLTDARSITDAVVRAGRVDILVNNAGFGVRGPVECVPVETVREMFETMFFGPLALIQAIVPGMRERGDGVVVTVSSGMAALVVRPLFSFYSAAKLALEGMSEGLAQEVAAFGIRVVILQPGNVVTNFRPAMRRLGQHGPYAELAAGIDRWRAQAQRAELKMDVVDFAKRAADVIESDDIRLRVPIGEDAATLIARRRAMTDEEFRAQVLSETLPPTE